MRMKDAIASLQLGRKKQAPVRRLCTVWSEQAENGPDAVPLAEYPRPQFRRAEWQCLNGWWEYSFRQAGGLTGNRIANSIGEQPAAAAEGKNHLDEQPVAAAEGKNHLDEQPVAAAEGKLPIDEQPAGAAEGKLPIDEQPVGAAEGKILVPFSPETVRSGVGRTLLPGQELWYRREIENLWIPKGKRLLLHFGGVDERCMVWWNGVRVGVHRNGYLAFSFDVTEVARPGTNFLEICVRDDTDKGTACRGKQTLQPGGMYYHAQSGIWQTVWLETVPEEYLSDLRFTPLLGENSVEMKLRFSGGAGSAGADKSGGYTGRSSGQPSERNPADSSGESPAEPAAKNSTDTSKKPVAENSADSSLSLSAEFPAEQFVRITVCPPVILKNDIDITAMSAGEDSETAKNPEGKVYVFRKKSIMKVRIPVSGPRLWSPESPWLYPVRIESGGDTVESYFAMRSFGKGTDAAGRPCLLLNGAPYFFHGVLDQGYWPESLMTPPADQAMVYDITQMKELGFNMLRKHVKIEPARWYWHCDRIGMVVWQDMVNGGGPVHKILETYLPTIFPPLGNHFPDRLYPVLSRQDAGARRRFEADLRRMIRQLYNCPCIGMWVPFNEGWGQFDALRIADEVKKEDPTRPVDHASGWFDQGGGDVRSVHNYFRPLTVEPDRRAFVLSEYGGADCSIPGHSMSEEEYGYQKLGEEEFPHTFRKLMEQIHALAEQGLAGAVYTQTSDIEEETNGLLTYDRKVRKA